jgi:two-component system, chemotaxis family, chemotaxis protein CheY
VSLKEVPKEIHILAVDDSLNIRRMIVASLQRLGFSKITTSEDVTEAMGKLQFFANTQNMVQLVLSDLNMPGPSGLEFLRQVRQMKAFESLPFILITTESEKGPVIEAAMSGVSGYIVKPFNAETLGLRIKEAWAKHAAQPAS